MGGTLRDKQEELPLMGDLMCTLTHCHGDNLKALHDTRGQTTCQTSPYNKQGKKIFDFS